MPTRWLGTENKTLAAGQRGCEPTVLTHYYRLVRRRAGCRCVPAAAAQRGSGRWRYERGCWTTCLRWKQIWTAGAGRAPCGQTRPAQSPHPTRKLRRRRPQLRRGQLCWPAGWRWPCRWVGTGVPCCPAAAGRLRRQRAMGQPPCLAAVAAQPLLQMARGRQRRRRDAGLERQQMAMHQRWAGVQVLPQTARRQRHRWAAAAAPPQTARRQQYRPVPPQRATPLRQPQKAMPRCRLLPGQQGRSQAPLALTPVGSASRL